MIIIELLNIKLDRRHLHVDVALIPIVVNNLYAMIPIVGSNLYALISIVVPPRPIVGAVQRNQHRIDEQREKKEERRYSKV